MRASDRDRLTVNGCQYGLTLHRQLIRALTTDLEAIHHKLSFGVSVQQQCCQHKQNSRCNKNVVNRPTNQSPSLAPATTARHTGPAARDHQTGTGTPQELCLVKTPCLNQSNSEESLNCPYLPKKTCLRHCRQELASRPVRLRVSSTSDLSIDS